jgi:hypothetical protein
MTSQIEVPQVTYKNPSKVPGIINPNFVHDGPKAYAKALHRFKTQPKAGAFARDTIAATDIQQDEQYLFPILVGTPYVQYLINPGKYSMRNQTAHDLTKPRHGFL